ncbi:MAG TPA: DM13 domain-containing protein [Acidimicrobiales bacterium]|nr:DM13 domain-containing protein [Acidimicrobiales bacterium]
MSRTAVWVLDRHGIERVDIQGSAAWELVIDQQLVTPIAEPPLPGMTPRNRLASGRFYGIEQDGQGTVTLYRLADGRRALRLAPFRVTANTDLVVWASAAASPRTSEASFEAPHVKVAELKATAGTQNYLVPDDVAGQPLASIVIWCVPIRVAYAAAPLDR